MGGWVKFEKDLQTDPRVLRIAKQLSQKFWFQPAGVSLDQCNAIPLPAVTLVSGALLRMWCYADSHIRDDDTLDVSIDELDEIIGLPGFCALLPPEWLTVVDDFRVELPAFQAKNGTEAKSRALTAKRVSNHRKRNAVTTSNAPPLPDQTRLDQTRLDQSKDSLSVSPTAPPVPRETQSVEKLAEDLGTDPADVQQVFDHWRQTWAHPQAKLDDKRRKLIRLRLRDYSPDLLCRAISGYRNSPHHTGQNDRSTVYDDIGLLLRDAAHVDAGLRFADQPAARHSKLTVANIARTKGWVPPEMRRAGNAN